MPDSNLHFPTGDLAGYSKSYGDARCIIMQGGQGEVKHWAFNDPPRRVGAHRDQPPAPGEYRKLSTRVTDLHPMTVIQNARTSGGGYVAMVPTQRVTVGPGGDMENARRSASGTLACTIIRSACASRRWMISKKIADASVPMSLLADHPNVHFHYYRNGIGAVRGADALSGCHGIPHSTRRGAAGLSADWDAPPWHDAPGAADRSISRAQHASSADAAAPAAHAARVARDVPGERSICEKHPYAGTRSRCVSG